MNQHLRKQARLTAFLRQALKPCLAICALAPAFAPQHAAAAATTYVWQEAAGGNWDFTSPNWSGTNHRWNGGSTSAIDNIASFAAVAPTGGDTAVIVNGAIKLGGLTFTSGNNSNYYDIQPGTGTLTFTGKSVVTATAGSVGAISMSLSTDTSSTHSTDTLTFTADSTTASAGQIFLNGNNTNYSVPSLTITGGALVSAAGASSLPDAAIVVGVTQIAGNHSTGFGNLDLDGNSETIASLSGAANGTITNSNATYATLTVGGPTTSSKSTTYAGAITDSASAVETTNNPTPNGGLGLIVQAPVAGYTLVLTGTANTYHGITVVGDGTNAATLQAGATNAFSANSGVNVQTTSTLDLNGFSQNIADLDGTGTGTITNKKQGTTAILTLAGDGTADTLVSSANLINTGLGTLALTKSGAYTELMAGTSNYGGATLVTNGTLAAGSATSLSAHSAYTINTPGILDLNGFSVSIGSLAGNGTVENGSGTVNGTTLSGLSTLTTGNDGTSTTFSGLLADGTGTLALTKTGLGTFTVTGASNSYTGGTNINQGVLSFSSGALSTGLVTFTGNSTLQFQSGNTQDVSTVTGLQINDGVTGTIDTNGNDVTFATALQTGPLATGALTKTGAGVLTLSATNTYTGGTTINGGTLAIDNDGELGGASGGVTINGGTLEAEGTASFSGMTSINASRTIFLGGNGGTISNTGGGPLNIDALITGSGPLNLSDPSNFDPAIYLQGTANNTYTGLTTIQSGSVALYAPGYVAISGNVQVNSMAFLWIDADAQIASTATATVNGELAFGALGNVQQTIGTLNGSGIIANVQNTTATLVVGAGNFSGSLYDGNGQLALTKQGHGTLILSSTNSSYSGATTINGGTLEWDGTNSGDSSITVNSGGALAGTGTVGGTVTVTAGGFLNPGTSTTPGTLTVGDLVLNTGATSTFRLGGAASDLVAVSNALTLGGNLSLIGNAGFGPGTYTLFTYGGALTNNGVGTITSAGFSTTLVTGTAGEVDVSVGYLGTAQYWDGTHTTATGSVAGGGGTWNTTSTNWTNSTGATNAHWQSGTALFSGTGGNVVLGGPINAEALFFNSTGYTLTSSTLTLDGPAPAIDVVNAGTSTTIASVIAGTSGLAATGAGTLILTNGANTYTGGTTITTGTLQLGTSTAATKIGSSVAIAIGSGGTLSLVDVSGNVLANAVTNGLVGIGTLDIDSANTNTLSGALTDGASGQLALTQNGAGTTILTNSGNTYSGTTAVSKGTLQIGTSTLAGSIGGSSPVSVGTGGTFTLVMVSGNVLDNNISNGLGGTGLVKTNSAGTLTLSGILSDGTGPLALTQSGAGTTILTGIDTYSGATSVNAGTLQVGNGTTGNLTGAMAVTVSGSGSLALDLPSLSTFSPNVTLSGASAALKAIQSGTLTVLGDITGAGAFDQNGSGTTIIINPEAYTGPTNVNAGTLEIDGALTAATGVVNVGTNGTLTGTGSIAGNVTLTGNGVIALKDATIGGTLAVTGGTWEGMGTVNGAVTSSAGAFTLQSGTVLTANAGLNVTGGTLAATDGTATLMGGLDYTSSSNSTFIGAIVDTVATPSAVTMNHAGATLTLNGANTYTGATTISAGTLQIGDGANGSIGTTAITVSGTGTLVTDLPTPAGLGAATILGNTIALDGAGTSLKATESGVTVFTNVISGTGSFDQNGSGTTGLEDAETYTGATYVNAGDLQVGVSLASNVVHVGTSGELDLLGTINNATLTGNGFIDGLGGQINGTLAVTGGNLGGYTTVGKAVTSSAGTFTIQSGATLVANLGLNVTGGTLVAADNTVTLTGNLNYTSSANSTFVGTITDGAAPSGVTMNHSGATLILNGANTYTGPTTVNAGTLQIGDGTNGSIETASAVTVTGGALAVDLPSPMNGFATFANAVALNGTGASLQAIQSGSTFFTGVISGTGVFDQNGPGNTNLEEVEKYTGATNVNEGVLEVDGSLASSVVHVGTNGELNLIGTVNDAATLTGSGIINSNGGHIGGTLTVTGGTWEGMGTVGKAVTSSAGTFTLASGANLTATGGVNVTGGTFTAADGTATLTGSLNDTSSTSFTFAGIIADGAKPSTVTVNKAGTTLTLSGASSYSGATTITAGTLDLADASSISSTSKVTIGTAGTLTVGVGNNENFGNTVVDNGHLIATDAAFDNMTLSGVISGTGNFTKSGADIVTLSGVNTYKGGTVINGGTLSVQNTGGSGTGTGAVAVDSGGTLAGNGTIGGAVKLNSGGMIAPGTLGDSLQAGSLTWNGGGAITLELGVGGEDDGLVLTGALTKGSAGTFDLDISDDGMTTTPANYTLLTFTSTNFKLSDFDLELPNNVTGTLVETSTSLMLDNAMDPPATSDDAVVADAPVSSDATDPVVSMPNTIVVTPTPEPGSALLLSLGGIALLGWRRRRRA